MTQPTSEDWAWLLLDDNTFVSDVTNDTDLISECSTVLTFDFDCERWAGGLPTTVDCPPTPTGRKQAISDSIESGSPSIESLSPNSNKDVAPMKPERKESGHDRNNRRRVRSSRNSVSSHTTYRTMATIAEASGGEESDNPTSSPLSPGSKRKLLISKINGGPASGATGEEAIMKLMKGFYDSLTVSNCISDGSDTDDSTSTDRRSAKKRNIKMVIKDSVREASEESELQLGTTTTRSADRAINKPTSDMMAIVEKLSVRAALVLTASAKKKVGIATTEAPSSPVDQKHSTNTGVVADTPTSPVDQEGIDQQGFPSLPTMGISEPDDDIGFGVIWKNSDWNSSSQSIGSNGSNRGNGSIKGKALFDGIPPKKKGPIEVDKKVPNLEESSSSTAQSDGECTERLDVKVSSTIGRTLEITRKKRLSGRKCYSAPSSPPKLTELTPQMKDLIEKLSVKAALSVISQAESSIIQDAVMDISLSSHTTASR